MENRLHRPRANEAFSRARALYSACLYSNPYSNAGEKQRT